MNDRTHDPGNADKPQQQVHQAPQHESNGPADVLRDGNIKATIWKNERENGPSYSTTFARTWQDEGGAYRDSYSFSGTELLRVSELARGAYARTNELRQEHVRDQQSAHTQDAQDAYDSDDDAPARDDVQTFKTKRSSAQEQAQRSPVRRK